jgi:hypothetical protein
MSSFDSTVQQSLHPPDESIDGSTSSSTSLFAVLKLDLAFFVVSDELYDSVLISHPCRSGWLQWRVSDPVGPIRVDPPSVLGYHAGIPLVAGVGLN